MKIAVLHDDAAQAQSIAETLAAEGHQCHAPGNSAELLALLRREPADMLLLSWPLADGSGAELIGWVREKLAPRLPVLLLAGSTQAAAIVSGLDAGADDYLLLPLRRSALRTRVRVLQMRCHPQQEAPPPIVFGRFAFAPESGSVHRDGQPLTLTRKEFALALLLFRHLGRPLSRTTILDTVWGGDGDVPSRTMDTHVSRVRSKLALRPENGFRLAPVYSFGYCLEQIGGEADEGGTPAAAAPMSEQL